MNNDHDCAKPSPGEPDLRALSALVDGELSAAERAATFDRLAGDAVASLRVANYRAQKAALQALFAAPQETARCLVVRRRTPWWRRVGVAAAWLAVGVALGWAPAWLPLRLSTEQVAFAKRADIAYAVYAPEQRHPVEVAAAEEDQLIKWLSKRLDRSLAVPSLQEYGYTLVGGRLLPGEAGPAAQFMYQNAKGERLTLYITRFAGDVTAFRVLRDGVRNTFYWANQGMGYALSGQVSETHLRSMAIDVCSALGGHPDTWQ
jgi:anti-sigma factor RsiW